MNVGGMHRCVVACSKIPPGRSVGIAKQKSTAMPERSSTSSAYIEWVAASLGSAFGRKDGVLLSLDRGMSPRPNGAIGSPGN